MKRLISFFLAIIALMGTTARTSVFALSKSTGDVNGDGEVNNKDVVTLFRFVSGGAPLDIIEECCDINGDDEIDNKDVVTLFRYVSAQTSEESETGEPNDNQPGRKEKNGFDTAEKNTYYLCGIEYKMPVYFVNDETHSEDGTRAYYAESGDKVAVIKVDISESDNLTKSDFELAIELGLLQELSVEGLSKNGDIVELVDNETITIDGNKCCLFSIKGTISGVELTGKIFYSYIESLNSLLSFILLQSVNTDYLYNTDFEKILNTIKIDVWNKKETIIENYIFNIPEYWNENGSKTDWLRYYAKLGENAAALSIQYPIESDPSYDVSYAGLIEDNDNMIYALENMLEDCKVNNYEQYESDYGVKGMLYSFIFYQKSGSNNKTKCNGYCFVFPSEKDRRWFYVIMLCDNKEFNNYKFDYMQMIASIKNKT